MTDQPTTPGTPDDPTAPPPPAPEVPPAPSVDAAPPAPAYDAPPPPPAYDAPPPPPAYDAPPPPPAYAAPPAAAAPSYGPPPPAANPYGGYTQAPQMGHQGGGQVAVGSLPYVEHHFGPVAQFGDRILPYLIDSLLSFLGFIPMVIGMFVMGASSGSGTYDEAGNYQSTSSAAGVAIGGLLVFLGFILIFAIQVWNRWIRQGRTGQSVGKKMFGLKLINSTTGQPIGVGMALVRDFINGLISPITQLWMLWDPNRQTLGDLVAKSTVIKVPKA